MKKGLGRGFDSLIPTEMIDEGFDPTLAEDERVSRIDELKLTEVTPNPDQPRRQFDEAALRALARSIREHGVLQPIVVTRKGQQYQIVAGERRYRASLLAGRTTIPAIVRSVTDQNNLELSLVENLQREDLNPIEQATAYAKLRDQFNLTPAQVAERIGKSEIAVVNTLRLLRLPLEIQKLAVEHHIKEGSLRPLIGMDETVAKDIVKKMIKDGLTVREIEQIKSTNKPKSAGMGLLYHSERKRLEKRLGMPVTFRGQSLTIKFKDQAELDKVLDLLKA
jgi:ParB family chromosome partitioning protein